MNQLKEISKLKELDNKSPVGSYESMKPWLGRIDELCRQLENKLNELNNETKRD